MDSTELPQIRVATCPNCEAGVHAEDMEGEIPALSFLLISLVVRTAVLDMMMQLPEYEPAREGWEGSLKEMKEWATKHHGFLDLFGEHYDDAEEEEDE